MKQHLVVIFLTFELWIAPNLAQYLDDYEQQIEAKLQLEDYDVNDAHEEIQIATKKAIMGQGFEEKAKKELSYGKLLRSQHDGNLKYDGDVPYFMIRNWTLLTFTGDYLLPENDFKQLVIFKNQQQVSAQEKFCASNQTSSCVVSQQDFLTTLAVNRNATFLNKTWIDFQKRFESTEKNELFQKNLQAINQVYTMNKAHTPRSYWEMLLEYEEGYEKAFKLWENVQPLYEKLRNFVKVRLFDRYSIVANESTIPVYLLGSNFGEDWSNIADIVLPHPYLLNEIETELTYQDTKSVFKLAESSLKTMLGPSASPKKRKYITKREPSLLGDKFWRDSIFNHSSCGPHLFSYCNKYYTEVVTCKKLNWTEYLNIHEAATETVLLRNQDYLGLPRNEMRYSALDEALRGIGSIVSITNLVSYNFVPSSSREQFNRLDTALLLTALRVLPRLPYYFLADKWRLEELEAPSDNLTIKWWKYREQIQGVQSGGIGTESDYLGDECIRTNRPCLSKFLGVFLQFQLIDYYQKFFSTSNGTLMDFIGKDESFKTILQDRSLKSWPEILSFHYGFDEISAEPLLKYFSPLEEYLEKAPINQIIISTTKKPRPTTTTTSKPTRRRHCSKCTTISAVMKNKTVSHTKVEDVLTEPTNKVSKIANVSKEGSSNKLIIFVSIAGAIVAVVVLVLVLRKVRRVRRSNESSRKYETK